MKNFTPDLSKGLWMTAQAKHKIPENLLESLGIYAKNSRLISSSQQFQVVGNIRNRCQKNPFPLSNIRSDNDEYSLLGKVSKKRRFHPRYYLDTTSYSIYQQSSVDDIEDEEDEEEYDIEEDADDVDGELMTDIAHVDKDEKGDHNSYHTRSHDYDDDNSDDSQNNPHLHQSIPVVTEMHIDNDLKESKEAFDNHDIPNNPWPEEEITEVIHELWRPQILSHSSIMTANQDPLFSLFRSEHTNNTNIISMYHRFYQDLVEEFRDPVSSFVKTSSSAIYSKKDARSVSKWFFDNIQEKNQNVETDQERRNEMNQQSLISLRGAAMIALYPQVMSSIYGGELVRRYQRGISLTLPAIFFPSAASLSESHMQNRSIISSLSHRHHMPNLLLGLLVRALATSFQSDLVIIDAQIVAEISQRATNVLSKRHKVRLSKHPQITTATVLNHLFTLLHDNKDANSDKRPITVVFAGDFQTWLLQDNTASETVVQQFQSLVKSNNKIDSTSQNNRPMFFLHLAPPSSPLKKTQKEGNNRDVPQQKSFNNRIPPPGMTMPMPPFPMRGMFPPGMIISGPFPGQNMSPSPASSDSSAHSPMMVTSRTFKVMVHKNGSFSMIPVQSSSSSPDVPHMGMSPMHNGMFPMPPEHIMKQIIEDQQRFMQQMQNNQNEGNQEHIDHNHEEDNSRDDLDGDNDETDGWNEDMKPPSNLSMEEIQENLKHLLEDPEALKSAIEYAQQSISKMISKQNAPSNNKNSKPNHGQRRMPFTRTPLPPARSVPNSQVQNPNSIGKNEHNNHNDQADSNSNNSDLKLSTAGKRLKLWFEPLSLLIPSRPASPLMYKWSVLLTAHAKETRFAQNIGLLQQELSRVHMKQLSQERIDELWRLSHTKALDGSLWTKVWQKEDIRKVITIAIRLQASAFVPPNTNATTADGKSLSETDANANKTENSLEVTPSHQDNPEPHNDDKDNEVSHGSKGARQELSRWALDTAFAHFSVSTESAEGAHVPLVPPSQSPAAARRFTSRDEIAQQLSLDKYEKNLLTNVVFPTDIDVSFEEVGGLSEVKRLLRQSITYPLKYPSLYKEGIAKEAVKGVLLFGPPGTGKTLLAKAVATEGGACFLSVDASVIENKWLGESEKNARAVFSLARKLAPCVVFFDEVDSLLSSRETGTDDTSSHGTLTSVKTTLMAEWDGLTSHASSSSAASSATSNSDSEDRANPSEQTDVSAADLNYGTHRDIESRLLSSLATHHRHHQDTPPPNKDDWLGHVSWRAAGHSDKSNKVIVIASTNRPFDLDEAVLRRLPRRILVDLPDVSTRAAILQVALANNRVDPTVNFTEIAKRLDGFTGSDIKEICREAVVQIAHEQAELLEKRETLDDEAFQLSSDTQQQRLRMVTARDLYRAMRRLRASVNEHGRELQKVVEWNEKYGEFRSDNVERSATHNGTVSSSSLADERGRGRGSGASNRRTDLYL